MRNRRIPLGAIGKIGGPGKRNFENKERVHNGRRGEEMNKLVILLAALLLVIPSVASANLLGDPGLEGAGNGPWINDNWWEAGDGWTWDYDATDQVHSGSQSFKVRAIVDPDNETWELAGTQQHLAISAGETLDAFGWIKASSVSSGLEAYLEAIFKDSLGAELGGKLQSSKVTSNTDWTQLTVSGNAPANAASVDVRYIVGAFGTGQTASGDFWYDDTSAVIPEPTSLLLLGSGLVDLLALRKRTIK